MARGEGKRNVDKLKSYFSVSTNFKSILEEKKLGTEEGQQAHLKKKYGREIKQLISPKLHLKSPSPGAFKTIVTSLTAVIGSP